jgi:queuine/archaeosine tRNA-ribosyltransferase
MLGLRLLCLHNVWFLTQLMVEARRKLRDGSFDSWSAEWLARYRARQGDHGVSDEESSHVDASPPIG